MRPRGEAGRRLQWGRSPWPGATPSQGPLCPLPHTRRMGAWLRPPVAFKASEASGVFPVLKGSRNCDGSFSSSACRCCPRGSPRRVPGRSPRPPSSGRSLWNLAVQEGAGCLVSASGSGSGVLLRGLALHRCRRRRDFVRSCRRGSEGLVVRSLNLAPSEARPPC